MDGSLNEILKQKTSTFKAIERGKRAVAEKKRKQEEKKWLAELDVRNKKEASKLFDEIIPKILAAAEKGYDHHTIKNLCDGRLSSLDEAIIERFKSSGLDARLHTEVYPPGYNEWYPRYTYSIRVFGKVWYNTNIGA